MRRSKARTGGRESARARTAHTTIAAAGWWCKARRRAVRWMRREWRRWPAMDSRRLALWADATAEGTRRRPAAQCEFRLELLRAGCASGRRYTGIRAAG